MPHNLINGYKNKFNMATTSLIVDDKNINEKKYIQITTQPKEGDEEGIIVAFFDMDETFEFNQGADQGSDLRTEEDYHIELRITAAEKNQLITSHSTKPEWNPEGYVKNLDQDGSM